jgi:hypothetical protein
MTTITRPEPATPTTAPTHDVAQIMGGLYGDGIIALKGAFSRDWAQRMREDIDELFVEALARPGGAVGRGPKRYYVEIHPERMRGFLDLVTHPWVVAVSEAVLGPDYKIVEIGFDVPGPGALNQPWHRDFPSPPETITGRRLNSLAFNLTGVDTTEEMGPFEIAPGTQWDLPDGFEHGMFPPKSLYPRYEARAQRKYPQMGDISCRSALTIHRGTKNFSDKSRPRARPRRRRAGRPQRRAPRPAVHARLLRHHPRARAPAPRLSRRRRARADRAGAHDRGAGDGGGVRRASRLAARGSRLAARGSRLAARGSRLAGVAGGPRRTPESRRAERMLRILSGSDGSVPQTFRAPRAPATRSSSLNLVPATWAGLPAPAPPR